VILRSLFLHVVDAETIRNWPFFLPDFFTHASTVVGAALDDAGGGPLTAQAPLPGRERQRSST
jgi:hypothetical protein